MEPVDESWSSIIAAFAHLDEPDALLDALLDDSTRADGSTHTNLGDATADAFATSTTRLGGDAWPEPLTQTRPSTKSATHDDSSASDAVASVNTPSSTTKRKKRVRLSRPTQEIQQLRQVVADLENLFQLERRRQSNQGACIAADETKTTRASGASGVWYGVAVRQYQFLRASQLENQQLRHQVRTQMELTQSLVRMIHRASRGVPLQQIPRALAEHDAGIVTHKRQHLFDLASEMYSAVDSVFAAEPFVNGAREFRETVICQHRGDSIPPGALLASTSISRLLPRSLSGLSELLWNVNQSDEAFHDAFKLEHREVSSHCHSTVYSVTIMTPYGPVVCHGVGLHVRHCEADRDVTITTGCMWPDSSTPSPRNAVAYDFKEWTIVKPYAISNDGGEQNQVLVRFETSRPSVSHIPQVRSHEQVAVLQHFIAQAHNFIVEQEQRQIDAILLGQVGRR